MANSILISDNYFSTVKKEDGQETWKNSLLSNIATVWNSTDWLTQLQMGNDPLMILNGTTSVEMKASIGFTQWQKLWYWTCKMYALLS